MSDQSPLSLRLTPEMNKRLIKVAEALKIPKQRLAQLAVEAAIEAAERDGALVLPAEMRARPIVGELAVTRLPSANPIFRPNEPYALNESDKPAAPPPVEPSETAIPKKPKKTKNGRFLVKPDDESTSDQSVSKKNQGKSSGAEGD